MAETKTQTKEVKEVKETKKKKSLLEKLLTIQSQMKVPKNLYNSFGKYNYRNAETILETVKPLLTAENCTLMLSDEVISRGEKYFLRATVTLYDLESNEMVSNSAEAELSAHTGMSADQTTGCASSYARKYAMNGMFLLDDVKDSDSDEMTTEKNAKAEKYNNVQKNKNVQW